MIGPRQRFKGPDHAVLAFYRAHAAASSPKGLSMGQRGRDYAFRCANRKCRRAGTRVRRSGPKGSIVERCSACGTPWTWTDAYIPAGLTHAGRGGSPPAALERSGDLCSLIAALETTPDLEAGFGELYVSWLCVGSKSIDAVAEDATRIRFHGRSWQKRDVRRAIDRSRGWLETQLFRKGLLDRG